jgi:thiol-disulfide isomerase/thioredoxin
MDRVFKIAQCKLLPLLLSATLLAMLLSGCSNTPVNLKVDNNSNAGSNSSNSTNDTSDLSTDAKIAYPDDNGASPTGKALSEGATAPDFSFTYESGESAKLSDYRGQVVFINFWASWCGPCMQEMPDINELRQAYPDVVILEINVSDEKTDALEFIGKSGYDVSWIIDDGTIASHYPSQGIPYTLILDKSGVISTIFEGSAPDMFSYFEAAVIAAGA